MRARAPPPRPHFCCRKRACRTEKLETQGWRPPSAPPVGLARDTVAVAVERWAIARLASVKRRDPGSAGIGAVTIISAGRRRAGPRDPLRNRDLFRNRPNERCGLPKVAAVLKPDRSAERDPGKPADPENTGGSITLPSLPAPAGAAADRDDVRS